MAGLKVCAYGVMKLWHLCSLRIPPIHWQTDTLALTVTPQVRWWEHYPQHMKAEPMLCASSVTMALLAACPPYLTSWKDAPTVPFATYLRPHSSNRRSSLSGKRKYTIGSLTILIKGLGDNWGATK